MTEATRERPETSGPRKQIGEVVNCFAEHDLLTSASAIAFRLLFAIVPLMLFALALASYLALGDLWRTGVAPQVAPFITPAAFGFLGILGLPPGGVLETLNYGIRLLLCVGLLLLSVGLLVRYAPTNRQPIRWVSFGSLLTVGVWLLVSFAFAWYLTSVAPYTTAFGGLASVIVFMSFLYVSAIAFLLGVQLDAIVREEVRGTESPSN